MPPTSDEWYLDIHRRLMDEDPVAPSELAENLMDYLFNILSKKYHWINDPGIISDAVTDALIGYVKKPQNFNPNKRKLLGYLVMVAERDLIDILRKSQKHSHLKKSLSDVELRGFDSNTLLKDESEQLILDHIEKKDLKEELCKIFNDHMDLRLVEMMLAGERSTDRFAEVLGVCNLSDKEKRKHVKRHKDRVKKKIERCGVRFHGKI
jgi:RNA polymerase sigma-70 factor (ECF subfamily)